MPFGHHPARHIFLVLAGIFILNGCSTTDTFEQPAPLPEIDSTVWLDEQWDTSVGDGHDDQFLFLQPTLSQGELFAVAAGGELVSVNPDNGDYNWEADLDEPIIAGVGADKKHLYLVSRDGKLLTLSRADGSQQWSAKLPSEVLAPPQSNGAIVVAQTIDGKALAFDTESGEKVWEYDGVIPVLSIRGNATPWVGRDLTLVAFSSGQLLALQSGTGQPAWQYTVGKPAGRTELERLVDVDGSPVVHDGVVYVTGYQGQVAAVDFRSGRELWSKNASSLQSPALDYNNIYISGSDGVITGYGLNNRKTLWEQDALKWRQTTALLPVKGYLLTGDFEGYIHVLSQLDGSLQGQREVDSDGLRVPMIYHDDLIFVYSNDGDLVAYRLRDDDD